MSFSSVLAAFVAPFNHHLGTIGQDAVTWAELLGFVTGAACVWLCVRASVWNFPVGIANNLFFFLLFWSARLYADASLQVVYLALAGYGWWRWLRGGVRRSGQPMGRAGRTTLMVLPGLIAPATWGLTIVLSRADDIAPFWDALTTALSLAAQWLLNAKRLENWYLWIAADLVYIPLYTVKALDLTAVVYVLMLGMCVAGLVSWRREVAATAAGLPYSGGATA